MLLQRVCGFLVVLERLRALRARSKKSALAACCRLHLEEMEQRLVPSVPTPDHVVIVIESNQNYGSVIGSMSAPYINYLAKSGASFTDSHGLSGTGEPNYLGLFSGSTHGVVDDGDYTFTGANLGSRLIGSGLTFAGFAEDLPYTGYTGSQSGAYHRYHAPWVSFSNLPASADLPFSAFPTDYSTLPTVSIVVPNFNDDMHDGTVAAGDAWLKNNLAGYAQWAQAHNSLLVVTGDHDSGTSSDQVATLFVGPMVAAGNYSETINHYNVLRTVEDMYGLSYIANEANVSSITDVWAPLAAPALTSAGGSGGINLLWTASGTAATGFLVERSTDGLSYTQVAALGASANSYSDTGLTTGTRYFYRVRATSAAGNSAYSNVVSDAARGNATHLLVSPPSAANAGQSFGVTVSALDSFNDVAIGYAGTVQFSGSDAQAQLPANYTFVAGDKGTHTFAVTAGTLGPQSISAVDTSSSSINGSGQVTVLPRPDHMVIVMEENHSYGDIIGDTVDAPYINNTLLQEGALFTSSYAISHPSEPNYLALFSGSTQGVADDNTYNFSAGNLAAKLAAKSLTFDGFSEDLPYTGYTGDTYNAYARKHAPWVSFSSVPTSANMPFSSFPTDYSTLPTVSFVIPNLNDDMHDGTIAAGDTWLKKIGRAHV